MAESLARRQHTRCPSIFTRGAHGADLPGAGGAAMSMTAVRRSASSRTPAKDCLSRRLA